MAVTRLCGASDAAANRFPGSGQRRVQALSGRCWGATIARGESSKRRGHRWCRDWRVVADRDRGQVSPGVVRQRAGAVHRRSTLRVAAASSSLTKTRCPARDVWLLAWLRGPG
jgi:hypothetical protein